ncbi:MAG: aminotransferase class IV [Actinobacteria bacterium]|nr:aminotransferase class IV [Actinomycetota bacterium]
MTTQSTPVCYQNGTYVPLAEATVPLLDPGFTRGDSVYDTTSVWKGQFFRLDDHVDRFFESCAKNRLAPPVTKDEAKHVLAECAHRAGVEDAFVQAISTRGPYASPTNRDPRSCQNTFYALAMPYIWIVRPERQDVGIDLHIVTGNRRTPRESIDPTMKNFNWLDLTKGWFEALDRGSDNAVLCSPDGYLSEGPGFNMFVVKDGVLRTPRGNVLEGITRRSAIELAGLLGMSAEEADLWPQELTTADEAFICSTAGGIMPVATVDGVPLGHGTGPGPVSTRFRTEYWARREAGWHGTPVADLVG